MGLLLAISSTALGVVLVLFALWDVFHSIFHPGRQGHLPRLVLSGSWRLLHRLRSGPSWVAGPLGVVGTIGVWFLLVVLGGMLVYLPYLPESFSYAPGLDPSSRSAWVDALYLSLTNTTTLGYGDVVPVPPALRLFSPFQALLGLVLVTASVSWVLQSHAALGRSRMLAATLSALHRAEVHRYAALPSSVGMLHQLAREVSAVRIEYVHSPEMGFFHSLDPSSSLPAALPYARVVQESAAKSDDVEVRAAAMALGAALEELSALLGGWFLSDPEDPLTGYARSHGHEPLGLTPSGPLPPPLRGRGRPSGGSGTPRAPRR